MVMARATQLTMRATLFLSFSGGEASLEAMAVAAAAEALDLTLPPLRAACSFLKKAAAASTSLL